MEGIRKDCIRITTRYLDEAAAGGPSLVRKIMSWVGSYKKLKLTSTNIECCASWVNAMP